MIYDVSMAIKPDIQVYKNKKEKKPIFDIASDFDNGSTYETNLYMNLHTGTHIDFPLHVTKDGKDSSDFPAETCITSVKVLDLVKVKDHITKSDLESYDIIEGDFVLFKTHNSLLESFDYDFIYLDLEAAKFLKSKKIKGVGTDGLGIERAQAGHPTHHMLLDNGIIIMEGLRLENVPEGTYEMICLPLKIEGVEALPVRAILKN